MATTSQQVILNAQARAGMVQREGGVYYSNQNLTSIRNELQQSFRFYLIINGLHAAYITDVARPSYSIVQEEYQL